MEATLVPQGIVQFLANRRMIDIRQLTPVGKSVVVASNPFDRFLLELAVILPGGFLHSSEVDYGFVPSLFENCDGEISLGAEVRLVTLYPRIATRETLESHRGIIAHSLSIPKEKLQCLRTFTGHHREGRTAPGRLDWYDTESFRRENRMRRRDLLKAGVLTTGGFAACTGPPGPGLVEPLPFLFPTYEHDAIPGWMMAIGIAVV